MKIWLIGSITPVNDVAGPLLIYRHFKKFEQNGHQLKVICHQTSGLQQGENWETVKIKHSILIKFFRRIFFRKYLQWIGEELVQNLIYWQVKKEFIKDKPDVIIGTWSDYMLIASYKASKEFNIPLVMICHDDYEGLMRSDFLNNYWKRKKLSKIYQHAKARLCVAEGMNEEFAKRFGVLGDVLYPIGGETEALKLQKQNFGNQNQLTFGYFGSISNGVKPLLYFANCLKGTPHQLSISSSVYPDYGEYINHPNIKNGGFYTDRAVLLKFIQDHIDVCVVAQSFEPEDKIFLETNFPSKLVDMSGMNLPVLIISPSYSSSGRIAQSHPNAFVHIDALDEEKIKSTINQLKQGEFRSQKAAEVSQLNQAIFSPSQIHQQLEEVLNQVIE
jgi:hypothetical protein